MCEIGQVNGPASNQPNLTHLDPNQPLSLALKASPTDPDTLSFDEAMAEEPEQVKEWLKAASAEIESLEKNATWSVVDKAEATSKILPGTWVFRRKRTPDGSISKYKARYCVRGDLEDDTGQEKFAPVVAWSTVRLFLTLSLTLKWETCTIDFSSAAICPSSATRPSMDSSATWFPVIQVIEARFVHVSTSAQESLRSFCCPATLVPAST